MCISFVAFAEAYQHLLHGDFNIDFDVPSYILPHCLLLSTVLFSSLNQNMYTVVSVKFSQGSDHNILQGNEKRTDSA